MRTLISTINKIMSNELAIQQAPMFGLSTLEEAVNFAGQMAKANLLPAHLKGSPADCLRVVMQAARWQMDPFSVADKTSVISGKLMYEGQLVSAVVNARGNLTKRLDYKFEGDGDKRVLTVTGTLKGESEPREITLDVAMAKRINKNGQMNQNPDQQMCYIGARMWARRHTSELMLGVYTPDEIDPDQPSGEPENVTPITDRPAPAPRAKRGVAGAKAAEVVVTEQEQKIAEPAKPTEDIQQAMKDREEKLAQGAGIQAQAANNEKSAVVESDIAATPEAIAPRAFLQDGEKVTVTAEVKSVKAGVGNSGGKPTAFVSAVLAGGFVGDVRSFFNVTLSPDGKTSMAGSEWAVGRTAQFDLAGKKSMGKEFLTDGKTRNPSFGKVIVWVEAIKAVESGEVLE